MPLRNALYIQALLDGRELQGPPPSDPPWSELAARLQGTPQTARAQVLAEWVAGADGSGDLLLSALVDCRSGDARTVSGDGSHVGRLFTLDALISEHFPDLPLIVGTRHDALIVRGEGHLIAGKAGVGKSLLVFDMALKMACGLSFLDLPVRGRLRVLIVQAELPIQFVRHRFNRIIEGFEAAGYTQVREVFRNIYIPDLTAPFNFANPSSRQEIRNYVRDNAIDVLIIDPFLPFFSGDENSNSEVRAALDGLKHEVALPHNCALVVTDHIGKADQDDKSRTSEARRSIAENNRSENEGSECKRGKCEG